MPIDAMIGLTQINQCLRNYLAACPPNFDFPWGGETPIPFGAELELMEALSNIDGITRDSLVQLRNALTRRQAYELVIFAVRVAVCSVRTNSARLVDSAILAFLVDDCLVDWRDSIRALSLIEDSARRLGLDLRERMIPLRVLMTERQARTIFEDYFERPSEMRSIGVMRFRAIDTREGLLYIHTL